MIRKYFLIAAIAIPAILLFFLLQSNNRVLRSDNRVLPAPDRSPGLVVHEWGTFTTLSGSDGTLLNGLYLDEEQLPRFVYQYQNFPMTTIDRRREGKGVYFEPSHVNVKMETPVLYFYSPRPVHASVRVDFPSGLISQWFPACRAGNQPSKANQAVVQPVDFASPVNGFMEWEPDILAPDTRQRVSYATGSHTWNTPRQTDANLVSIRSGGKEDIEKFIFYRGIAHFTPPVTARFIDNSSGSIGITNRGSDDLPFVFVYERTEKGDASLYWQGAIKKGERRLVGRNERHVADFSGFEKALVAAGLYPKEAKAMLETWKASYFDKRGIRVFWIVPENLVNALLPLHITPQPRETRRVFVGRYELLTPAFESGLFQAWKKHPGLLPDGKDITTDRYWLAYEDLIRLRSGK
jgi:hypothetical protein